MFKPNVAYFSFSDLSFFFSFFQWKILTSLFRRQFQTKSAACLKVSPGASRNTSKDSQCTSCTCIQIITPIKVFPFSNFAFDGCRPLQALMGTREPNSLCTDRASLAPSPRGVEGLTVCFQTDTTDTTRERSYRHTAAINTAAFTSNHLLIVYCNTVLQKYYA